ncbi:MAG: hypothetical protein R2792_20085 [Saprospiraceae bacterium]
MDELYNIDDLDKMVAFLKRHDDLDALRKTLLTEFLKYADYKNGTEWNRAVTLCECLALIGWGKHEPLEATRGMFFNGSPTTTFLNKFRKPRFVNAMWSKRKNGFTMEPGRTSFYFSPDDPNQKQTILSDYPVQGLIQNVKLKTQRNWISKNPIRIRRAISNCYENSKEVIESIEQDLQLALDQTMQPEKYGDKINQIFFNCHFSYAIDNHQANYVICEDTKKLSPENTRLELNKLCPPNELVQKQHYLTNRFKFGSFRSDTGRLYTDIYFEKAFSELSHQEQKEQFSEHASTALQTIISRLKKKKLAYNLDQMLEDFTLILEEWKKKPMA